MPAQPLLVLALLLLPALAGCASPPPPAPPPPSKRACEAPALPSAERAAPAPERATFEATDGVTMVGSVWPGDDAHVVVLVHGRDETRASWGPFAEALASRGFRVLAFDLRGHGDSTSRGNQSYEARNFTTADFQAVERDVRAVAEASRKGGALGCLAVVGSGLGANAALRAAATAGPNITLAALLSPTMDDHGVTTLDAMRSYGPRPVFFAAAFADIIPAQSAQRLASETKNATLRLVGGEARGTALLPVEGLGGALADWLMARV